MQGSWGRGTGSTSWRSRSPRDDAAAWIDVDDITAEDDAAIAAWLADAARPKVLHDAKGPMLALAARGWPLAGVAADTALSAYVVKPDQRSYDLADLSVRYLKRELRDESDNAGQLTLDTDTAGAESGMLRARATLDLADGARRGGRAARRHRAASRDVELPLVATLARMERTGIAIDDDHLIELESEFAARAQNAAAEAYAAIGGKEINLGSPKQLQVVLFDELGMPKTKKTKTGYTTDAEALQQLFAKTEHPFLQHLLDHRDVTRLRQTVEGLRKSISDDGRIHTTYAQTIAATGRLSSNDPNLQNIPIRTASGRRIREAFCVGEGFETLRDGRLQPDRDAHHGAPVGGRRPDRGVQLRRGLPHRHGGEGVRQAIPSDIDGELRARIKAMNYGLAYGLSAYGLSQQLSISTGRGAGPDGRLLRAVRRSARLPAQPGRRGPPDRVHRDDHGPAPLSARSAERQPSAPRDGRADGAQRPDPGIGRRHHQGRDARRRARARRRPGSTSRMLLQVHDELVLEVAAGEQDAGRAAACATRWPSAAELSVPLDVSVGIGRTWHEAGH